MRKTKLEVYIYKNYGSITKFCSYINLSYLSIWNWINKVHRPSKRNAEMIEKFTRGKITADYLRNNLN